LEDLATIQAIIAQQERGLNRQAIQPRPSKATLLVNPGDRDLNFPLLDSRYRMVEQVEPVRRSFSWTFIAIFSAPPAARTFWIRHSNANDCPAQERCHHWQHLDGGDWFTPEENAVDLELVCVRTETIATGMPGVNIFKVYDDEVQEGEGIKYTDRPCYIFDALKPDFSIVEQLGFQVLRWNLVGAQSNEMMDQCGRLIGVWV
jgi:hypothetical protein